MKTVCEQNKCAGCMACVDICPKNAIKIVDSLKSYNAVIDERCVDCGACHKICQNNHPAVAAEPKHWYQGWSADQNVRIEGSSGGVAMALAKTFVNEGGLVCSCCFSEGGFGFKLVDSIEELHQFAGSKYVKSNPKGIFRTIRTKLTTGEKILFIGLPCQVSALRNYVGKKLEDDLYSVDLICHGTPSPELLNLFLKQYGKSLTELKDIRFRNKGKFQVTENSESIAAEGVSDRYMISFLSSLTYTDNCYECSYAKRERVADLTLGDSWGSDLSETEWKKGISLILCQTEKGKQLLEHSDLVSYDVDINKAISRNHQLEYPSNSPQGREKFFKGLKTGKSFDTLVMSILPKKCLKQNIKRLLMKIKILS